MSTIKFSAKRIQLGREWCGVHYGTGPYISLPEGTITVYCKGTIFPPSIRRAVREVLENDTDIMVDYFASDRLRILPGTPLYQEVAKAAGIL